MDDTDQALDFAAVRPRNVLARRAVATETAAGADWELTKSLLLLLNAAPLPVIVAVLQMLPFCAAARVACFGKYVREAWKHVQAHSPAWKHFLDARMGGSVVVSFSQAAVMDVCRKMPWCSGLGFRFRAQVWDDMPAGSAQRQRSEQYRAPVCEARATAKRQPKHTGHGERDKSEATLTCSKGAIASGAPR